MDNSEDNKRLSFMIGEICTRHIPNLSHTVTKDLSVYVTKDVKSDKWYRIGCRSEVIRMSQLDLVWHIKKTMNSARSIREEEFPTMYNQQNDNNTENAKKNGETLGQFFVAMRADMPFMIIWQAASLLGKMLGHTDIDSNDAFKEAFISRFHSYQQANPKLINVSKSIEE